MENLRLESDYKFFDTLRESEKNNRTFRETILMHEKSIEDPRVPKDMSVAVLEARRQALFAKQMGHLIGDSEPDLFTDSAPTGAFSTNKLERLDMNIRSQALRTYATRDIPFQYGGGAIESVKGFKENVQLPKGGFIGGDTNQVRQVNIDYSATYVPVKPLTYGLRLGYIDSLKNEELGYDAITKMGEAIQRAWFLDIDRIAYVGVRGENGTTDDTASTYRGLLNQENAETLDLETTTDYTLTTKKLENMNVNTVIEIFIGELNDQAKSVDWEARFVPNKILFYKELFAWLNQTATDQEGTGTPFRTNKAILQEALDGWCDSQDFDRISMVMLPYLSDDISDTKDASMVSSGTNDTGRVVIYRQDPYVGYLPLPMDLTGGATVFDINTNAFRRNYISFVGYLLQFYQNTIRYIDNGESVDAVSDEMQDLIDGTSIDSLSVSTKTITHVATYPTTIDDTIKDIYALDAIITFDDALPTGTIVDEVTYEDSEINITSLVLAGRKVVWLSELAYGTSAGDLRKTLNSGHEGATLTMAFKIADNAGVIDTNMNVKMVVSDDNFATWTVIAEENEYNIEMDAVE